jgi:Rod binding domain-containing protein
MLPPIDTSAIPPDVRKAGPEAVKVYSAALQFEGMLVQQITEQMFQSTQDDSSGDDESTTGGGSGRIGAGPYQSMLPTTLSDAITQGGGLGLAPELYRSMSLRLGLGAPPAQPDPTGGEGR